MTETAPIVPITSAIGTDNQVNTPAAISTPAAPSA